jgi:hypothetical protein
MQGMMRAENNYFEIVELKTPETGGHSKRDRIERLEPDIHNGRFLLPCVVHHRELGGLRYWSVWTEQRAKRAEAQGKKSNYNIGQIIYRELKGDGLTARQIEIKQRGMNYRIVTALKRRDENRDTYDLTRVFIEEASKYPPAEPGALALEPLEAACPCRFTSAAPPPPRDAST